MDCNTKDAIESTVGVLTLGVVAVTAVIVDGDMGVGLLSVACAGIGAFVRHVWPVREKPTAVEGVSE